MQKKFIYLTVVLVSLCPLFLHSQQINDEEQNTSIQIIVPPVICRPVAFPLVATVTNTSENEELALQEVEWEWDAAHFHEGVKHTLKASGKSDVRVRELRERKENLSMQEAKELAKAHEKWRAGTHKLSFQVQASMSSELLKEGSLNFALTVTGSRKGKSKSVKKEIVLKAGRIPERPLVPPGAHHSDWYFGDTHCHSTYTWDYIFGDGIYTIPELKQLAIVAGLDWLVLTDHVYCLDSCKFNTQKTSVTSLCDNGFAFLYGEELSCAELVNGVKAYDTCHCNGIMNSSFVSCSTDIFRKASAPDSQAGINYLKQRGGLVTINHANYGTGSFEAWNFNINTYPYTHGENGMELLNDGWNATDEGSTTRWVDRRLLKGEKVFAFAGSDTESANHLGECYTVTYADYLTQGDIKNSLACGHQYVTNYPGLSIWARQPGAGAWAWMGDTLYLGTGTADIYLSYVDRYAGLNIYIMKGENGWSQEEQIYIITAGPGSSALTLSISVEPGCYLRAYCVETNNNSCRAYTTPIWFN